MFRIVKRRFDAGFYTRVQVCTILATFQFPRKYYERKVVPFHSRPRPGTNGNPHSLTPNSQSSIPDPNPQPLVPNLQPPNSEPSTLNPESQLWYFGPTFGTWYSTSFFVRELQILVARTPPQGVLQGNLAYKKHPTHGGVPYERRTPVVRGHAGLELNHLSHASTTGARAPPEEF